MKFISIIASIFLFCNNVYSQDLKKLDEKNGFKSLILGTSLDKVKKDVRLKEIESNKKEQLEYFTIKDLTNYTILDFKPVYVNLIFFKKELMEITIKMPDQYELNSDNTSNNAFGSLGTTIIQSLAENYGTVNEADANPMKSNLSITIKWTGGLVTLIYCDYKATYDDRGVIDVGPTLHFISNNLYQKHSTFVGKSSSDF